MTHLLSYECFHCSYRNSIFKFYLKQAQATDPKLDSIRRRVDSGNITVSRGLNRGETKFIRKKRFDV